MKYEAKINATTGRPESTSTGSPWVNISWYSAKDACQRAGAHLVNEGEWMTIARNIAATLINDLEGTSGIQLATGHSDSGPASALTAAADPVISGCTLTQPLSDAANASTGTCALRGTLPYTGTGHSTLAPPTVLGLQMTRKCAPMPSATAISYGTSPALLGNGMMP